jgi:NRPS condensation-like uncharacterized protein
MKGISQGVGVESMDKIPKRFRTTLIDRVIHYVSYTSDPMIQMEFEFGTQVDIERITRAIDLTLNAEPVLGCRFVEHWRKPYWKRVDAREREVFFFTKKEAEYEAFKSSSINPYGGPQIRACVWASPRGDRFLLKAAHYATDAGGLKDIVELISSIYSRLANEPGYRPEPNVKGSRGLWQVLRHVPWHAYPRICFDYLGVYRSQVGSEGTHTLVLEDGPHTPLIFIRRLIPKDRLNVVVSYGRTRDATLNDLMIAAFFRALAIEGDWDGKTHLGITTTIDFRKWYLPTGRASAVTNLSGSEYPTLGTELGKNFDATLKKITAMTSRRKGTGIGLNDWVGALLVHVLLPSGWLKSITHRTLERQIKNHNVRPFLTNLGEIDPESLVLDSTPLNAWILPPPAYVPQFIVGFSGYAGTVNLSAGVYSYQKKVVEQFLDRMISELPS